MGRDRISLNKRGRYFLPLRGIGVGAFSRGMIMSGASDPWDDMHSFVSAGWICAIEVIIRSGTVLAFVLLVQGAESLTAQGQ